MDEFMVWHNPLPLRLIESSDSESFLTLPEGCTALPVAPHPGSFGFVRKNHVHEGIDLYCTEGTSVHAVEEGRVVGCLPFTGKIAGSPWWMDTYAVLVEGQSGVVVYGEILPLGLQDNLLVRAGDILGTIATVLKKDKGRPRSMLHLELHEAGTRDVYEWKVPRGPSVQETKPPSLRDPTPFLRTAISPTP
jgi:Peptidase family M23